MVEFFFFLILIYSLRHSQHSFSLVGTGLPGLNQLKVDLCRCNTINAKIAVGCCCFFSIPTKKSFTDEPVSCLRYKLACALIEDSDQPAHSCSLFRVVYGRFLGSHVSDVSSDGKLKP